MNTEHLRYFLTVAKCGSIGKASEQLQLKQQYLSSVIRSLEQQLGTPLFDRHTRGVTLTADGTYLHGKISQIVQLSDEIRLEYLYPSKSIYREAINDIDIYTVPQLRAAAMGALLTEYRRHFPNVAVHMIEKNRSELLEMVRQNDNALGVIIMERSLAAFQQILPQGLRAIAYRDMEMAVLTSPDNPTLLGRTRLSREELLQEELVAYAPRGVEYSTVYRMLKPCGEPKITYVVDNSALFLSLLHSGPYYSIGARDTAEAEGLLAIPFKDPVSYHIAFVLHEEMLQSFSVKSFINLLLTRSGRPVL